MNAPLNIKTNELLQPADSVEEFRLHCAAVEWSLVDPIVLNSAEEIQSRPQWEGKIEPFLHQQQNLFTFCRRLPCTLLADDVGLGKTISAGLIISELMIRRRVSRTLVLCPNIIAAQWKDELSSKFGIEAVISKGVELVRLSHDTTPVVITSYESARQYIERIAADSFDFLILDEAHKLRNLWGAVNTPETPRRIRRVLESRVFKYVLMLTATPMHNRLFDIYSLIDLLTVAKGHANPFGSPKNFKTQYVSANAKRVQYQSSERFCSILRDYIVRTRRTDAKLKFPSRQIRTLRVQPSPEELVLLEESKQLLESLTLLAQISLAQAMISSPRALISQLANMEANGGISSHAKSHLTGVASRIKCPSKLQKLFELIEQLRIQRPLDWRLVVFTTRRPTLEMICDMLLEMEVPHGIIQGGAPVQNQRTIEQFRMSTPEIHVVVTTDAGAEGVNLQSGNVLVNYDLPWNPMIVEQRIGRLQRLASKHETVEVLNLAVAGSVEDRIVIRLIEKLQGIASAIGDIESIIEADNWHNRDDEPEFQQTIAKLVVNSLLSQDVSAATELAERNIELARDYVETQRHELDQLFGDSADGPDDQITMPTLLRSTPSLGPREFVLRAKIQEGLTESKSDDDTTYFYRRGQPAEIAAFSPASVIRLRSQDTGFGTIHLYQPGKADFERLVQKWITAGSHHIYDGNSSQNSDPTPLAVEWAASIAETNLVDLQIERRTERFDGNVHVKVRLANGVDSYEKIITQSHGIPRVESEDLKTPKSTLRGHLRPSDAVPKLLEEIAKGIETDADLNAFRGFYDARMQLDLRRAGGDPQNRAKVEADFRTSLSATVTGIEGIRHEEFIVRISYTVMGGGLYQSEVGMQPAIETLTFEPRRARCWQSAAFVPVDCLDTCSISGHSVLKHLLKASDKSGVRAIPQFLVTCDITGAKLLPDETQLLHDGRRVDKELAGRSSVSQLFHLITELVRCDFTGKLALPAETLFSDVSGHRLTVDDKCESSVSGTVGYRNEFVLCDITHLPLLPWESDISDYSHRTVRADLLMLSENIPARKGLNQEFQRCAVTGRRILLDEGAYCSVSRVFVDRNLLFASHFSGSLALLDELVVCGVTSQLLLPGETGRCALTGQTVDQRLLSLCEVSGRVAQRQLLERCQATAQLVVPDVLDTCVVTGQRVLSQLLAQCSVTGQRALPTSLLVSSVSGRRMIPSVAVRSDVSHKVVTPDEVVYCEVTRKTALPDEVTICGLTGRLVLTDLTSTCAETGIRALTSEFVICEESQLPVVADLVTCCAVTGKQIRKSLLEPCAVTHKLALPREMVVSSVSGKRMVPSVVVHSHVSEKAAAPDEVFYCEVTGKIGLPDEVTECGLTGRRVLTELTSNCAATGTIALTTHLVVCEETQASVIPDLVTRCAATGKLIRKSLLEPCSVTHKLALPRAMVVSSVSGKRMVPSVVVHSHVSQKAAAPDEVFYCEVTGKIGLPDEVTECGLTGRRVLTELTSNCAATGIIALTTHLVFCEETQASVIPDLVTRCAATGKLIRKSLLEPCSVTHKLALPRAMVASSVSQRLMLPKVAVRSARSSLICHPDESVMCQWLQKRIPRSEAGVCRLTGLIIDQSYLNSNRELKALRKMLDGTDGETVSDSDLVVIARSIPEQVGKIHHARITRSPSRAVVAVSLEARRGFILPSIHYLGLVFFGDGNRHRVLGKIAVGKWSESYGWIQDSQISPVSRGDDNAKVSAH